jgi:hypothetical protein
VSITDPAEDVQPDEGQGGGGESAAPYQEWLDRIPEEVREDVEPVFKEWDANVTRRFQENSQYREQWSPYEELGVNKLSPDEVQWALDFRQAAVENPQAVKEWYEQFAQANNLVEQAVAPEPAETTFDQYDPNAQLEQLLKSQLEPLQKQLQEQAQWREQQEFSQRKAEADRFIEGQMSELRSKHPDAFADTSDYGAEKMIDRFIGPYIESDPQHAVQRAFADYQALVNQVEKAALQVKADAPAPAETGGPPDVTPEKFSRIDDVKNEAIEFLRNSNRA